MESRGREKEGINKVGAPRVSCSSCLAGIHLLCDDLVHKIRDPISQDKFFNLGTTSALTENASAITIKSD